MLCKEASLQGAIPGFAQETGQRQGRSGQRGQGDA